MNKTTILTITVLLFSAANLPAQEHPGTKLRKTSVSQEVQTAIHDYLQQDIALKGRFMLYDEKNGMARQLEFEKFHTVNQLDEGGYFTCTDFRDQHQNVLDVDFYIDRIGDQWKVSRIKIHKINNIKQ